jgi:uncharacterized protein
MREMLLLRILFYATALLITISAGVYTARRLIRPLPLGERTKKWAARILVAMFALPFVSLGIVFLLGSEATLPLIWVAMLSLAYSSWLVAVAATQDLVRAVRWIGRRLSRRSIEAPVDHDRRRLVQAALSASTFGGSALLLGAGTREALAGPSVIEVEVPIVGLPLEFDRYSIAQISDLHVGLTIRRDYVETVLARTSDIGADAIAITGDMVDGRVQELRPLVEPLTELRARDGIYFVTGNHEYISGADPWLDEVARYDMIPLLNEHRVISRGEAKLVIGGVVDRAAGRFGAATLEDHDRAFSGAPIGAKRIMLAHQPVQVEKAAHAGADLQLSGHTHGGQFFPWNLAIHMVQPHVAGLGRHERTWIYVNRGTGYWGPPVRLGPTSEITKIILRRA